jgi:hypothetical protein
MERLFPPHHIQYFTPQSLRSLSEHAGFEVAALRARVLPVSDVAASALALAAIAALQMCDRLLGREILLCITLRRPLESVAE